MAVLAPDDDDSRVASERHGAGAPSLPSLDERVELFLRAIYGTQAVTAQQRAAARLRILDAVADDLAGDSVSPLEQNSQTISPAAPVRTATRATARAPGMLTRLSEVLREALLWPLMISGGQPMRLAAISCATLLVAGGAWTATWFYAAHRTETAIASLLDSEAKAGRDYSCGSRSVGGFPLHVEVNCTALQAKLAMSDRSTVMVDAKSLRTVASLLSPGTFVTEISGPVSVTRAGQSASVVGNWSLAQLTVQGQPSSPSRVSVLIDNAEFDRVGQGSDKPLLAGSRIELDATAAGAKVINIAARAVDVSIPDGGPITSRPFVADISAVLHDFDATPQMLSQRLRDWQARGGRLEVASARIQQGDALASGTGQIGLSADGTLDGALRFNTSGPYERLAQSYIHDGGAGARKREQLAQSFLGQARIQTRSLGAPPSEQPARKQQAMPRRPGDLEIPIRFLDGGVILGSTNLGEIPPLF